MHPLPLHLASNPLLSDLVHNVLLLLPQDILNEASDRRPIFPAQKHNANDVRRYPPQDRLHLPHFMEVRAKEPVSRQHLCEVVVHFTMATACQ